MPVVRVKVACPQCKARGIIKYLWGGRCNVCGHGTPRPEESDGPTLHQESDQASGGVPAASQAGGDEHQSLRPQGAEKGKPRQRHYKAKGKARANAVKIAPPPVERRLYRVVDMGLVGGIEITPDRQFALGVLPAPDGWRISRVAPLIARRFNVRIGMPWEFARERIEKKAGLVQRIGENGTLYDDQLFL